jgi:hypothetical protein
MLQCTPTHHNNKGEKEIKSELKMKNKCITPFVKDFWKHTCCIVAVILSHSGLKGIQFYLGFLRFLEAIAMPLRKITRLRTLLNTESTCKQQTISPQSSCFSYSLQCF